MEDLRILNPSFIKDIIPETDYGYPLYLPKTLIGDFIANEQNIYKYLLQEEQIIIPAADSSSTSTKQMASGQKEIEHVVQKGEWLSTIARKYNVTVQEIKDWNKLNTENLFIGQKLKIITEGTGSSTESGDSRNSTSNTSTGNSSGGVQYYTIKSGDTLWSISQKYNTTVENLRKWNNLHEGRSIQVGMKIIVAKS